MKQLYRSTEHRMVVGILGGIGEYFDIDPALIRVGFVFGLIITGIIPLTVLYLISYVLIPERAM